jgi:hypothetical protein
VFENIVCVPPDERPSFEDVGSEVEKLSVIQIPIKITTIKTTNPNQKYEKK